MHMDATIERLASRVVDGRDSTPQRNSTGVFLRIQFKNILWPQRR